MIRISGRDAVAEAIMNMEYCIYSDIKFFIRKNDGLHIIPPDLIPILIEGGEISAENITCEIPSIWDLIELKKERLSLSFFRDDQIVLVFTPLQYKHQKNRRSLIQPFAVERSDFDRAEEWARSMPAMDEDDVSDMFLDRLIPRIYLKKGAWKFNRTFSAYSNRLIGLLESIYGIHRSSLPSDLSYGSANQENGILFDRLLDAIAEQYSTNGLPPPAFCL